MFDHPFLTTGIFAGLMMAWQQIKTVFGSLSNLVLPQIEIGGEVRAAVVTYMQRHAFRSPFAALRVHGIGAYVIPRQKRMTVAIDVPTKAGLFFLGRVPIWFGSRLVGSAVGQGGLYSTDGRSDTSGVSLTYIRGTLDPEEFLRTAIDFADALTRSPTGTRFRVEKMFGHLGEMDAQGRRLSSPGGVPDGMAKTIDDQHESRNYLHWRPEEIGMPRKADPFSSLALAPEAMAAVTYAKRWLAAQDWYAERGIPWQKGLLLCGIPGSGKTSFARALGQTLDLPVFAVDLSTFGNRDFSETWGQMLNSTPCIILLEDIDAVFAGRQNRNTTPGALTFDCLLNCISGVETADGVFLLVTTNHPDSLDPALGKPSDRGDGISTRPGRVDRVLEFGLLSAEQRRIIADRILADLSHTEREAVILAGDKDTGAQFQARCEPLALNHFWSQQALHIHTEESVAQVG